VLFVAEYQMRHSPVVNKVFISHCTLEWNAHNCAKLCYNCKCRAIRAAQLNNSKVRAGKISKS